MHDSLSLHRSRVPAAALAALLVSSILAPFACAATSDSPSASFRLAEEARRSELLATLRARLDRLAAAPVPGEPLWEGGDLDLGPLVGATWHEIRATLGEPSDCGKATEPTSEADPSPPRCRPRSALVYVFYRLPERTRGGGPELRLAFDPAGRCSAAWWVFTQ